ncbi:hypothetical protein [Corallococcus exiguus]|uniref:hypothetical protein n=1 Tax=Corallococcus exiguus TaxID=83462 RepID=UPI001120150F|nr:hypothetical protein [Corallococcus exiguus]
MRGWRRDGFPKDKPRLKDAFGTYAQAMFEEDPNKKIVDLFCSRQSDPHPRCRRPRSHPGRRLRP